MNGEPTTSVKLAERLFHIMAERQGHPTPPPTFELQVLIAECLIQIVRNQEDQKHEGRHACDDPLGIFTRPHNRRT